MVTMTTTVGPPRRASGNTSVAKKALGATVLMVLVVSYCTYSGSGSGGRNQAASVDDTLPSSSSTSQPAERQKTLAEIIEEQPTLKDALDVTIVSMADTRDESSAGALQLAVWAAKRMTLEDVKVARDETGVKAILKDSDAERGKRMCVTGRIVQIAKDEAPSGEPIYIGLLRTGSWEIVHFLAVRSSQGIVEDTRTRLCGVVTGRFSYSNAGGGTSHAVQLVGVFDIPANRAPPPVAVKPPPGTKCLDPKEYTEYGAKDLGLPLCGRPATAKHRRPASERAVPAAAPDRVIVEQPAESPGSEQVIDPFEADPEAARQPAPE
jgi:hypothetical protein